MCTNSCVTDDDCDDPALPECNIDVRFVDEGICTPSGFICRWGSQ
jgi:hypothetical protein